MNDHSSRNPTRWELIRARLIIAAALIVGGVLLWISW